MERIWLKSYPPGVPAEIDTHQYSSLVELFEKSIRAYADRPAFTSMGKTLRFSELDALARNFGAWLQSKGLAKGARVAIMMPNCLQYPIAMFGTLRAGGVVVNVNPLYTARELEHQVKDAGAEVIVLLGHDDLAFLQYTGGTTGVSKGAMLLHRNVIAALLQYKAWLEPAVRGERPVIVTALPLYHIFSLTVNCLNMMVVGGENILITNPRDIPGFVKELAKHKFTMISGVNTLFNALLNHPDFAKLDFSQ